MFILLKARTKQDFHGRLSLWSEGAFYFALQFVAFKFVPCSHQVGIKFTPNQNPDLILDGGSFGFAFSLIIFENS